MNDWFLILKLLPLGEKNPQINISFCNNWYEILRYNWRGKENKTKPNQTEMPKRKEDKTHPKKPKMQTEGNKSYQEKSKQPFV